MSGHEIATRKRKRTEDLNEFEVTTLKYTKTKRSPPWRVWWKGYSAPSDVEFSALSGISKEFLEHARNNPGYILHLNISHLKKNKGKLEVKTASNQQWQVVQEAEIEAGILKNFLSCPEPQQRLGVTLTQSSVDEQGCCGFSVLKLFPELENYRSWLNDFRAGVAVGTFVNWLGNTTFGEYRLKVRKVSLSMAHPLEYLTKVVSEKRSFLLLTKADHVIGVEGDTIYCALNPGKCVKLNAENFKNSGGSLQYCGRLWELTLSHRSF